MSDVQLLQKYMIHIFDWQCTESGQYGDDSESGIIAMLQVLNDASDDAVTVTPRHIFSVILVLVKAGHAQHFEQVSWHTTNDANQ